MENTNQKPTKAWEDLGDYQQTPYINRVYNAIDMGLVDPNIDVDKKAKAIYENTNT